MRECQMTMGADPQVPDNRPCCLTEGQVRQLLHATPNRHLLYGNKLPGYRHHGLPVASPILLVDSPAPGQTHRHCPVLSTIWKFNNRLHYGGQTWNVRWNSLISTSSDSFEKLANRTNGFPRFRSKLPSTRPVHLCPRAQLERREQKWRDSGRESTG